jgi:ATP-binding cassette subfamily F protein 3
MAGESPVNMVPMIRTILGGFLFSGDDAYKKVGVLSGGERNRLALAKMLLKPSNLLLLDEPTNHLDLDSKEILLEALDAFEGTIIFVSHDRHFVDRLARKVIDVGDGKAEVYPGGYEDFLDWRRRVESGEAAGTPGPSRPQAPTLGAVKASVQKAVAAAPAATPAKPGLPQKPPSAPLPEKRAAASDAPAPKLAPRVHRPDANASAKAQAEAERQARIKAERVEKKRRERLVEMEARIAEKEAAIRSLDEQMAAPGFFEDRARGEKAAKDREQLMWDVNELMTRWEMLQTEEPVA